MLSDNTSRGIDSCDLLLGEPKAALQVKNYRALSGMAFDHLGARRVAIRMNSGNRRRWQVAGGRASRFQLYGGLRQDTLTPQAAPRDTRVFSRLRGVQEPA